MIWLPDVLGRIDLVCREHEGRRALQDAAEHIATLLSHLCDAHVTLAPAPHVGWEQVASCVMLSWSWQKQERDLSIWVDDCLVTVTALDQGKTLPTVNPTEARLATLVRSFFEGYLPS